jgi:hypothetical protein
LASHPRSAYDWYSYGYGNNYSYCCVYCAVGLGYGINYIYSYVKPRGCYCYRLVAYYGYRVNGCNFLHIFGCWGYSGRYRPVQCSE